MTNLQQRVSRAVDGTRLLFIVLVVLTLGFMIGSGVDAVYYFIAGPLLLLSYHATLWLVAQYMIYTITPDELQQELKGLVGADDDKIKEINRRLEDGSLEADSEELDKLMQEAGLRPLSILLKAGEKIGHQNGLPIYDWVESKEGNTGPARRYEWVGIAKFDENGVVIFDADPKKTYVIVEGMLYERLLEEAGKLAD